MIDAADPDFAFTPARSERRSFHYVRADDHAMPAVSIVTPFFNTDPAIFQETATSVLGQSLQQWEWVIVDDGSTRHDSLEVLRRLAVSDPRVRVVTHTDNRGLPAARNTAISTAKSAFILPIDSDDLIEPTAAEKWLWFLSTHPEFAWVNSYHVAFGSENYLWKRGFHDYELFLKENLANPTGIARRDLFSSVGGFDETLREGLEDWEFWLRCAASGHWGATLPEFLWWYRRSPRSAERWSNWDNGSRQQELLQTWLQRYPDLRKGRFPQAVSRPDLEGNIEDDLAPSWANKLVKTTRRLLLLIPWTTMGGADKFNLDLLRQLNDHGWEATIVTTLHGDHGWMPQFARVTPDIFALSHFLQPEDYPRFLRYIIESRQPDAILITNSRFAYEALPYLRRVADGIPILDYCHSINEDWLGGGYPRMSVDRSEMLDLQVVASEHVKDWMVRRGADPEKIEVCYTNVDPDYAPDDEQPIGLELPGGVPIIVYPARMSKEKQPSVFAETMLELRRRGHDFVALAIGDGPDLPWLKTFVRRKRLGRHVRCLGLQSNARTRAFIEAADCVFLPSTYEGISLAFFEAMAAGVPVVGADVGGQRELVTPDCGVLLPRARPEIEVQHYADALGELLDDPDRRRAMGEACRVRIRNEFTLVNMGSRMNRLLRRASELGAGNRLPLPAEEDARRAVLAATLNVRKSIPPPPRSSRLPSVSPAIRGVAFKVLSAIGMPPYRLGIRMGMHWLEPMKDRVFAMIYPNAE